MPNFLIKLLIQKIVFGLMDSIFSLFSPKHEEQ